MTEYDFTPEAYERYIRQQQQIASWVYDTNRVPKADPYQAATPAVEMSKELLPDSRGSPWAVPTSKAKKPRRHRTPSEREFDRERKNDWKYMAAATPTRLQPHRFTTMPVPRTRRASYDSTPINPPPPLQSRSLHPGARYPIDHHRFSDSQDTSSGSETFVYVSSPKPAEGATRKRSASVQAPIRVPLPGPLPGPMPTTHPAGQPYGYGAQKDNTWRKPKPTRSQTDPLPPPPTSAPAYPSPSRPSPYQSHNRYYSTSNLHSSQQQPQPSLHRPSASQAHQYGPYAPSPLSPPNSAPAYPYQFPQPYGAPFPEPPKSPTKKAEPFYKRVLMNMAGGQKGRKEGSLDSHPSTEIPNITVVPPSPKTSLSAATPSTPPPPSPAISKWLGNPVKNRLMKTPREQSEPSRSNLSLDHWPASPSPAPVSASPVGGGASGSGSGTARARGRKGWVGELVLEDAWGLPRDTSKDRTREKDNRKEKEKEKEKDRGRTKERDVQVESSEKKERHKTRDKDREKTRDKTRDKSRHPDLDHVRDRSRSRSRERRRDRERGDKDRDRDKIRDRERERDKDKDKDKEREERHRRRRHRERSFERDQDREVERKRERSERRRDY